jgi:ubiquinone/menaquinone biosynthesis C-methylase UbiE
MSSDHEGSGTLDPERYDRWFERPWGRHAFAVERDALLAALGSLDGQELLDVGCGTGRFTEAFEHAGAQVTGIDDDPAMLTLAASRTDATLLRADAHTIPLPDDTFDVAVAVTLLEFADDPRRVVDELIRVTRPGGRIAVATLNPHSPWGLAHRRELRNPPWSGACLHTRRQLRELLAGRGRLRLHAALFAPGVLPGLTQLARLAEHAGRRTPSFGAFQIAMLDLPHPPR